ncbi:MAG: hypothetical protein Gyms2KO_30630 [Gymnodinialimonas sp.]
MHVFLARREFNGEARDHALVLQAINAVLNGAARDAEALGKGRRRGAGVFGEKLQKLVVEVIHAGRYGCALAESQNLGDMRAFLPF